MSRLIDGDALKTQIEGLNRIFGRGDLKASLIVGGALNAVDFAQTIDAVPVVRCEECCYWQPPTYQEQEDGSTVGHCTAALNGQQTDAYWFCADGTR